MKRLHWGRVECHRWPILADSPIGIYKGIDANGKPCQVEILKYEQKLDPETSDLDLNDSLYSRLRKTIEFKTSFSGQIFHAESTHVDEINKYTSFSLSGKSGVTRDIDVRMLLDTNTFSPLKVQVPQVRAFG